MSDEWKTKSREQEAGSQKKPETVLILASRFPLRFHFILHHSSLIIGWSKPPLTMEHHLCKI
jgi:hypothetical protein